MAIDKLALRTGSAWRNVAERRKRFALHFGPSQPLHVDLVADERSHGFYLPHCRWHPWPVPDWYCDGPVMADSGGAQQKI